MASTKTRYFSFTLEKEGLFSKFLSRKKEKDELNLSDLALLRHLLTPEKIKILFTLKQEKPSSIYALAKLLNRDFKAVWQDLKLLGRFGFIEFHKKKEGKRMSLIPILIVNSIELKIDI